MQLCQVRVERYFIFFKHSKKLCRAFKRESLSLNAKIVALFLSRLLFNLVVSHGGISLNNTLNHKSRWKRIPYVKNRIWTANHQKTIIIFDSTLMFLLFCFNKMQNNHQNQSFVFWFCKSNFSFSLFVHAFRSTSNLP